MKQTIAILAALMAVFLLATGFIVASNMDTGRTLELREKELLSAEKQLNKLAAELERSAKEQEASAEALRKTMAERDALSQQLNDAVLSSQEANEAVEQQIRQNQKQLREMESLAAEYEDLSKACDALEARILSLSEEAAQTAMTREAQTLADAKRIAELEAALELALASAPNASGVTSYADSEQPAKEPSAMMIDIPAQPDEGPAVLPTPDVSGDNQPAQPGEGPVELPTPEVVPQQTIPRPQVTLCPLGYSRGIVQNGQTFTDLLLQHNVSWQAMRSANPSLSTTRIAPGTRYCIPPAGSRRLCPSGTDSYVMGQFEDLNTLSELFGVAPGVFLTVNTQLAPGDFTAGRVICVP